MHKVNPIVMPCDERPFLRPEGGCGYCTAKLAEIHDPKCVCRTRTVVVEYRVRIVERLPESWDARQIEFHHNDSSWCASNGLDLIAETQERIDANVEAAKRGESHSTDRYACPCGFVTAQYVREATEEDEAAWGVFAEEVANG